MARKAKEGEQAGHDGVHVAPPASELWEPEQVEEFLSQISQGIGPDLAGPASLGMTATKIGHVIERDEEFRAAYEAARADGRRFYKARLRSEARKQATVNGNPRILEVELATHIPEADEDGPGYGHLRRDRVRVDGKVTHGHVISFDPSALAALTDEELDSLQNVVAKLGGHVGKPGELHALPPAEDAA